MKYEIILLLSVIGLFLANYIYRKVANREELVCVIGKDCNKVVNSKFGKTFGIDNTLLGMLYYVFVLIVSLVVLADPVVLTINPLPLLFLIATGVAALFSLYLSMIQVFVLKELCEYCLGSALLSIMIFIVLIV